MNPQRPQFPAKGKAHSRSSSDRVFGYFFGAIFAIVAIWPRIGGGELRIVPLALGIVFLLLAIVKPGILAPLNKAWTKIGFIMGAIVSPVVLAIVFYAVIVPIGTMMRLSGKDPLCRKYDRRASTYWIRRTPSGPDARTMNRQF